MRKTSDEAIGIYTPRNPTSEWSYDFVGEITDIDPDDNLVFLNINSGLISLDIDELNGEMKQLIKSGGVASGNRLYVPGRADLVRIN